MSVILTKPLIVPEFVTGMIKLYTPNPSTGEPKENSQYTVDMNRDVLNNLLPGRVAKPNCCKLLGVDLFVSINSHDGNPMTDSQAVIILPGYLRDPAKAKTDAFIFTLEGDDYLDIAFDKEGNLYVAEQKDNDPNQNQTGNQIVKYKKTNNMGYPLLGAKSGNNYLPENRKVIGRAGENSSIFANLVFDAEGNLWVTDAQNNRVVVFDEKGLTNSKNSYHVLVNLSGSLNVANISVGINSPIANLFAQPEGLDFDSFDANANLWVANNNDGGLNTLTSLVKIPKALQDEVLKTGKSGEVTDPLNAKLTLISGDANNKFFIYQVPTGANGKPQFGGLQVDKAVGRMYVNEEVSRKGRAYDLSTIAATPNTPVGSELNIVSTNPGNGGIALLQLGAFLADDKNDLGREPNTTNTPYPWGSLAISVIQSSVIAPATLPPYENVTGGKPSYLYVEVKNFGSTPTLGIETLDLRWAKASSGLGWPAPWNDTISDPVTGTTMGGTIKVVNIPEIPAFGSKIVGPITWTDTPDPSKYSIQDGHFCLLARIVTPNFGAYGMSYPEQDSNPVYDDDLVTNVLNNARIAWLNVHIINPITGKFADRGGVQIVNYTKAPMAVRLAIELLDSEGERFQPPAESVLISATGASLDLLRRSSLGDGFNSDKPIALPNIESGIDNITLAPNEAASFIVDYITNPTDSYAVTVLQYAKESSRERLIGGQTFVKGKVKGFPIKPSTPDDSLPEGSGIQQIWWWILLVILVLLILYWILK
jgi:hypothetical protein